MINAGVTNLSKQLNAIVGKNVKVEITDDNNRTMPIMLRRFNMTIKDAHLMFGSSLATKNWEFAIHNSKIMNIRIDNMFNMLSFNVLNNGSLSHYIMKWS